MWFLRILPSAMAGHVPSSSSTIPETARNHSYLPMFWLENLTFHCDLLANIKSINHLIGHFQVQPHAKLSLVNGGGVHTPEKRSRWMRKATQEVGLERAFG
jgi:hypothetical protein